MSISIFSKHSFLQQREKVFNLGYNAGTGGITGAGIAAEGGTESTITVDGIDYRVHEFNSSGTFALKTGFTKILNVEYVVLAGGGGAGSRLRGTGGGGAGGYTSGTMEIDANNSIVIGAGGAGASTAAAAKGANGSNTTTNFFTAIGGGGGAGHGVVGLEDGLSGGSGGGGGNGGSTIPGTGGSGTSGQGNNGGNGFTVLDTAL